MVRASIAVTALLAACGGSTPPPAKPEPPQPVALADLDGEWRATDIDGWTYELAIKGESYQQTIRRTTGGPCVQKGTVQAYEKAYGSPYVAPVTGDAGGQTYGAGAPPAPDPRLLLALVLTLQENGCNPDYAGAQMVVLASDYHGARITLRVGVGYGGAEESHQYQRFVAPPPAAK